MADIFGLENKTAVVIGGTSGIGRMLSIGLAQAGADVVASARPRRPSLSAAFKYCRDQLRICESNGKVRQDHAIQMRAALIPESADIFV